MKSGWLQTKGKSRLLKSALESTLKRRRPYFSSTAEERVVVERIIPVDAGTPVILGEANFYEGKLLA